MGNDELFDHARRRRRERHRAPNGPAGSPRFRQLLPVGAGPRLDPGGPPFAGAWLWPSRAIQSLEQFRGNVLRNKAELIDAGSTMPGSNIEFMIDSLETSTGFPRFSASELRMLAAACARQRGDAVRPVPAESEVEPALLSL